MKLLQIAVKASLFKANNMIEKLVREIKAERHFCLNKTPSIFQESVPS